MHHHFSMAQTLITSDDLSPLVLIITWILCIISVLCMVARVATSIIFARPIKSDGYSSQNIVHQVPQCCSVHCCHRTSLERAGQTCHRLRSYSNLHAANILYLSCMCLSELSVVLFLRNITPVRRDRQLLFGLGSITIFWTVTAVIVSATEHGSPVSWNYLNGHRINHVCNLYLPASTILLESR